MNKWELIGKLHSSTYRLKVLRSLSEGKKTPKVICKETDIKFSHISSILKELKDMKLIKCLSPKLRKGRVYSITTFGKEILRKVK